MSTDSPEVTQVPSLRVAPVDWAAVYGVDLVYQKDCWKLCGDAHCCSFSRHKERFALIGKKKAQELPLLPGEYEFMLGNGWLRQFEAFEHKRAEFPIDGRRAIVVESIVSERPGCACDHATRPTICRLYPLFPVLDIEGRLTGVEERFGIYEELEGLASLDRACALTSLPFEQLALFIDIVNHLTASPLHLFYLHAYRVAKRHAAERLRTKIVEQPQDPFSLFEWQMLRGRLVESSALRAELLALADAFEARYGDAFRMTAPSST